MKRITPLFDRVLVQRVRPQVKVGGILLADSAVPKTNEAKIIAVGKGLRSLDGKFTPLTVKPGDTVLLADYRGDEVKLNNEEYILIREEDILAKLEDTDQPNSDAKTHDLPDLNELEK